MRVAPPSKYILGCGRRTACVCRVRNLSVLVVGSLRAGARSLTKTGSGSQRWGGCASTVSPATLQWFEGVPRFALMAFQELSRREREVLEGVIPDYRETPAAARPRTPSRPVS